MRSQTVRFSNQQQAVIAFPDNLAELPQAITTLGIAFPRPVLFLSGGFVEPGFEAITQQAIHVITRAAAESRAIVISGATDMGVMALIGQEHARAGWEFSLLGITVERRVTWPGGPKERRFFWQKQQRGPLEPHHAHFILVPGEQFGDEAAWIMQTMTVLSGENEAITVLMNGGKFARQEVTLSLEAARPVLVLAGTGRLADELAGQAPPSNLMTIIPAAAENELFNVVCTYLTPGASSPTV